jgi:hypothetical protein
MRMKDLTGKRFGRVVAQWPVGRKGPGKYGNIRWLCLCDCGKLTIKIANSFGNRKGAMSCGCLQKEKAGLRARTLPIRLRHGHTLHRKQTSIWCRWNQMIQRCENPHTINYKRYGGRGIKVCERWRHSFEDFLADVGLPPEGKTLDRINNDGNYEPGNVRWATLKEQQANRRKRP